MKKSKLIAAALAATMFTTAACGLVACGDGDGSNSTGDNGFIVSFNADGGVLNGAAALYTDKEGVVKGTIPTAEKEDTSFRGWALTIGADESAVINFSTYKFEKDKTVYAVYKAYDVVTITYDYGDGIGTRGSDKTVNGKLASLPTPTPPANQAFKGWYTKDGTEVTTDTVFTQNGTIYAQYSDESTDYTNYGLVGDKKFELKEVTIEDVEQAFTATVNLQANDVVSFYVNGQLISASGGDIWIGMKPSTGKKTEFAVERTGTYEFTLSCATGVTPAWTLTGDDGTIVAIKNDYYLIGKGAAFGNWKCLEENHLGTTSGQVQLTVGATPAVFKVVKAADRMGNPNWSGGDLGADNVAEGAGYLAIDHETDGSANTNIRLETPGTYTVALVGGEIVITSENVTEPEAIAVKGDYYIVGEGGDLGNWTCKQKYNITSGQVELTVGNTFVAVKIAKCGNAYTGAPNWDVNFGSGAVTVGTEYLSPDPKGGDDIVLAAEGTYTITFENNEIEITSEDAEPGVVIGGPTTEMVTVQNGNQDDTHPNVYLIKDGDKTQGYLVKYEKDENGYVQYKITVALQVGDKVAIYIPDSGLVCTTLENSGIDDTAETKNGNIEIKSAKTYTFYFKTKTGDSKIWLAW
ncbi:MAG: hypothetical protein K2I75_03840 [Clostridiales bacterium]|nr:hypothetical protein [Clostridiales bacterium]